MRAIMLTAVLALVLSGCNDNSVYQEYIDFDDRYWIVKEKPEFSFEIRDTVSTYDIYCNVRNTTMYPNSRLFVNVSLTDTTGKVLQEKLVWDFLFEPKTGKPLGKSGLGDLYDHQIPVLKKYKFRKAGVYQMQLEQFMRTDTLAGVTSVGVSVERSCD